ncbi:MAG TPA: hypothetical protein VK797_30895 [Tepidisphaeraceae bacterium]|jgi:hypothetical protein|nr:hypothetical protein [Tepidisphaeraceae bacterium]
MYAQSGNAVLAVNCRPGFSLKVGDNLLASHEGCEAILNDLLEASPAEFGRKDLGVLNLLCAPSLPGSENLDIRECVARLAGLTEYVRSATNRRVHRYSMDPEYGHSEPMWRMSMLITKVKRDFGAAYDPRIVASKEAGIREPMADSRDMFIHGLLDDDPKRRWGTCASIPVLVTAVARRLAYPVGLAVAGRHIYARWEGRESFNIEASNLMGMTIHSDDYYRQKIQPVVPGEESSAYYVRTLFPAEEFALFLTMRVELLVNAARYDETLLWAARALQFAPHDPRFPHQAHEALEMALRHRSWRLFPQRRIPASGSGELFTVNFGELLAPEERSLAHTIVAHFKESLGELDEARIHYEESCRQNFHGNNEQRDLQRFLRRYNLPRARGPLWPPKNFGVQRCFKLACPPHEEAAILRFAADQFERSGRFLQARGASHDLYMFDPGDELVFQRARAIEQRPQFQEQLAAAIKSESGIDD